MTTIKFILLAIVLPILFLFGIALFYQLHFQNSTYAPVDAPQALPYAVLISTNLVRQNCSCGFCDPSRGVTVPEHINQLGYDLRFQVSTNYLPIVYR